VARTCFSHKSLSKLWVTHREIVGSATIIFHGRLNQNWLNGCPARRLDEILRRSRPNSSLVAVSPRLVTELVPEPCNGRAWPPRAPAQPGIEWRVTRRYRPSRGQPRRAVPRQWAASRQMGHTSVSSTTPRRQDMYEHRTEAGIKNRPNSLEQRQANRPEAPAQAQGGLGGADPVTDR